jgi:Zn-dependent peptidase ImmA (M78 family)
MSFNRKKIAIDIMQKALTLRKKNGHTLWEPLSIFDFTEKFDIKVKFVSIPSLEGIYSNNPPVILINSLRPAGRQGFTCAHELGHHVYKHGTKLDEINEKARLNIHEQEYIAECFAGFLLMTQLAIQKAFTIRNWDYRNPTPVHIYVISHYLGVGYTTLINHMTWSLHLLSYSKATMLLKNSPKKIKQKLLNDTCSTDLIVVDRYWIKRAIDMSVDDFILTGKDIVIEGTSVELIRKAEQMIIKAVCPGISKIFNPESGWAAFVRVSRKEYEGCNEYRHLKEVE